MNVFSPKVAVHKTPFWLKHWFPHQGLLPLCFFFCKILCNFFFFQFFLLLEQEVKWARLVLSSPSYQVVADNFVFKLLLLILGVHLCIFGHPRSRNQSLLPVPKWSEHLPLCIMLGLEFLELDGKHLLHGKCL